MSNTSSHHGHFLTSCAQTINGNNNYKYCHQDGSHCIVDLDNKNCCCAWYLVKGICKHLVAACIKTTTNLPGLVFMPKLLVTRWRRKKPIYLSGPEKVRATDVEQLANVDDLVVAVSENIVFPVSCDVVSVKQKVRRPRKIGKAIDVDCTEPPKKSKRVKRLVNYQPRR